MSQLVWRSSWTKSSAPQLAEMDCATRSASATRMTIRSAASSSCSVGCVSFSRGSIFFSCWLGLRSTR